MPYKTEWIDPDIFIEHEGVRIYHTYKDEEWENGRLTYWFTTSEDDFDEICHFDVRDIRLCDEDRVKTMGDGKRTPSFKGSTAYQELICGSGEAEQDIIAEIIRKAIEQGLLKQDEPYPA